MKIFAALALVAFATASFAQKKTDSLTIKVDQIFKHYNKTTPGVAFGIVRDGKAIFKKGYGVANLEYDIPITSSSIFDIASVSKQFAGLAISMLVQEGKVTLTDDVHKYIPEVPDFGQVITVNHLVHHTSGLRDWPEGLNTAGWRWHEDYNYEDIKRMLKHQKELDFVPGSKYSYSNTGYVLMAMIVERVSGKTFREWTDENIFKPLQMTNSHFCLDGSAIVKNMAYSYRKEADGYHNETGILAAPGSSSLFTNVDDLLKWAIHFQARLAAKDPVYLRMLETIPLNNGDKNTYGFGLGTGENENGKFIAHTGSWAGYATYLVSFPDKKLAVILLSNDGEFNVSSAADKVLTAILGSKKPADKPADVDMIKNQPTLRMDETIARKQEGTYKLGNNWYVTFTLENGTLMTQANREPKFSTQAKSDSTIWIDDYNASVTFIKSKDGSINAIRYKGNVSPRVVPAKQDLSRLTEYVGMYYSEEFETTYKIDVIDNKLMLHHMRLGDFELTPHIELVGAFTCNLGVMEFTNEGGKVSGFKLSRGRTKNLKFAKIR